MKNKDFLGQTKTEEIRCQQSYPVRNVKSSSQKENKIVQSSGST